MKGNFQQGSISWEQIFDAMPDLIFVIDHQHRILYANRNTLAALGVSKEEILSTPCYHHMHGTSGPPEYCPQNKTMQDMCPHITEALVERLGRNFWIMAAPILDQYGKYMASVHIARDITERVKQEEQLRHASVHDTLTGLFNRSWFEAEIKRITNGRISPISVIMADVDGLKAVNDTDGHEAGDNLLRHAANLLTTCCRQSESIARIGGDEFVVILSGVNTIDVEILLTRIRKQMREEAISGGCRSVSLSLGAATTDNPQQLMEILKSADQHMYKDKKSRRRT